MWIPRIAGPARRLVGVAALVGLLLSGLVLTTGPRAAGAPDLKTDEQKTLYALGIAISRNLVTFGLSEAELEIVKAGLTDGALQKEPKDLHLALDVNVRQQPLHRRSPPAVPAGAPSPTAAHTSRAPR